MTTAHRPTFDPARGHTTGTQGPAYHQRLLKAHTHLKMRQRGQGGIAGLDASESGGEHVLPAPYSRSFDEVRLDAHFGGVTIHFPSSLTFLSLLGPASSGRNLRTELLAAEAAVRARRLGTNDDDSETTATASQTGEKRKAIPDDISSGANGFDDDGEVEDPEVKRRRLILEEARDVDASSSSSSSSSSSEESSEDGDEEDKDKGKKRARSSATKQKRKSGKTDDEEEARTSDSSSSSSDGEDSDSEDDPDTALMREFARIKAERALATQTAALQKEKEEAEKREVEIARGNPLMNEGTFTFPSTT